MAAKGKQNPLAPQALVAGAATAAVFFFLWRKSATACRDFHSIYHTPGPIWLTDSAQEEAFSYARLRMRSVTAAGQLITPQKLQLDIANEVSPKCEWSNVPHDTSIRRRIWDSFGHIADFVHKEFYAKDGLD